MLNFKIIYNYKQRKDINTWSKANYKAPPGYMQFKTSSSNAAPNYLTLKKSSRKCDINSVYVIVTSIDKCLIKWEPFHV